MNPKCPHCDPEHGSPNRCAWGVRLGPALAANATGPIEPGAVELERDSDGQPAYLYVAPTNGAHVAQEDADWLFNLIRTRGAAEAEVRRLRDALLNIYGLAVRDNITGTLHAALNLHTILGPAHPEDGEKAAASNGALRKLVAEILSHFTVHGHPGEPCLRTGWVSQSTVVGWHQTYRETDHA